MIALVMMLFMSQPVYSKSIDSVIEKYSKQFNLDKKLVTAIIEVETNGNNNLVSSTNDYGIMQVNINTAKHFKFSIQRMKKDTDYSVYCGTFYLAYLRAKHSKVDKTWWARYHSNTPELKQKYIRRILNVYDPKNKKARPKRYYTKTRDSEVIWPGPIIPGRTLHTSWSN